MPYVITNGTDYVMKNHCGKFVTIRNAAMADEFSKAIAENVLNNQIPKKMRASLYLEKVDTGIKSDLKEIPAHSEEVEFDVPENVNRWIEKLKDLNGLANEAGQREKDLNLQLSDVDQRLSDLLHYCEFCSLNAAQGYKVYKKIKEYRQQRRQIKNELEVVRFILNKKITDSVSEDANELIHKINAKRYEPRVLKELFDV